MRANNKDYFPEGLSEEEEIEKYMPAWFDPTDEYFLRIVYDGDEIKPKFCSSDYCKISEF